MTVCSSYVLIGPDVQPMGAAMADLGYKIVKTNSRDEILVQGSNYEICKAAFEKALFVYPKDYLEMRQGSRIILKSKDRS